MKNSTLGILIVLAGDLKIFDQQESSWIVSALLIGGGTGMFLWRDKKENNNEKN